MSVDHGGAGRVADAVLLLSTALALLPLYLVATTASSPPSRLIEGLPWLPGTELWHNLRWVLTATSIPAQLLNSLIVATAVTVGSCLLAFVTASATVFFRSRLAPVVFALVMATQMLPLEVRIVPTYGVMANVLEPLQWLLDACWPGQAPSVQLDLLDSYSGMIMPLLSSATATFMLRQALLSLPLSLLDAARLDGAGPLRFLFQVALPAVRPTLAAAGVLIFVGTWNQYLWPLIVNSRPDLLPAAVGIAALNAGLEAGEAPRYHYQMAAALLVVLPPLLVVLLSQRWLSQRATPADK